MVRNRREDVVEVALGVLDRYGLGDLTVRRLATELGVQPSALYHHFASKQLLLAAVAEAVLERGPRHPRPSSWEGAARAVCTELRDALLSVRDGAEVVATVHAFGLGAGRPYAELVDTLSRTGGDPELIRAGARALLYFVFGHAGDEQTQLQAGSAGVITTDPGDRSDFGLGLGLVLTGIAAALDGDAGRADVERPEVSASR